MKSMEIEEKIKWETDRIYFQSGIESREDLEKRMGWLVGLATARTIWNREILDGQLEHDPQVEYIFQKYIKEESDRLGTPKTPYEQGEKEALKWVLEGD